MPRNIHRRRDAPDKPPDKKDILHTLSFNVVSVPFPCIRYKIFCSILPVVHAFSPSHRSFSFNCGPLRRYRETLLMHSSLVDCPAYTLSMYTLFTNVLSTSHAFALSSHHFLLDCTETRIRYSSTFLKYLVFILSRLYSAHIF